jgi:hypothetical protein
MSRTRRIAPRGRQFAGQHGDEQTDVALFAAADVNTKGKSSYKDVEKDD